MGFLGKNRGTNTLEHDEKGRGLVIISRFLIEKRAELWEKEGVVEGSS